MDADRSTFIARLEEAHRTVKGVDRDIRFEDRIAADLQIDSLDQLEVVIALEEEYDIVLLEDARTAGVETVGQLYDLVKLLHG